MSMRSAINRNPMVAVAVAVVVIGAAIWSVYNSIPKGAVTRTSAYYSTDDGQTWFGVDTREVPPIKHDGKSAVLAHLYTCPDGKQFVGYLERYTDEAKAVLDNFQAAKDAMKSGAPKPNINMGAIQSAGMGGRQIKKPGDKEWTNANGPAGEAIKKVTCPDGQAATAAE